MGKIDIHYDSCKEIIRQIGKCIDKIEKEVKYMNEAINELHKVSNKYKQKNDIINNLKLHVMKRTQDINRLNGFSRDLDLYIDTVKDVDIYLSSIL